MRFRQYLTNAIYLYKHVTTKATFGYIICASVVSFIIIWTYFFRVQFVQSRINNHPIPGENHIIFIESSCTVRDSPPPDGKGLLLTARQACSVESAAITNPNVSIYLLYTCPIIGNLTDSSPFVIQLLKKYTSVRICEINLDEYFEGTPLEKFYKYGGWHRSGWPRTHASDVLRYLSLWKYGGTYLDLDNIVIRSLEDLGTNFVGVETRAILNSGVLNLGMDRIGRYVAARCVNEVRLHFRGDLWGGNGPEIITRVIKRLCNTNETSLMTPDLCFGFTAHPQKTFYAIFYTRMDLLFNPSRVNASMETIKDSYTVHTWNHVSAAFNVTVGSRQPFALLAEEFCPNVYQNCGPIF